jgi:hypothetical protein
MKTFLFAFTFWLLFLVVGCTTKQATPLPPTAVAESVVTTIPTDTAVLPTATSEPTLTATDTAVPTPIPTDTPTPDPVWSILFTGSPCSATASDCSPSPDSPPTNNYFIYSDGTELQLLSEMDIPYTWEDAITTADLVEVIQLSPDRKRMAYMEDDNQGNFRFWIGDVGGDSFAEVPGNAEGFWPYSFYGNDPNCLAGFDEQKEDDVITTKLYKSCIGDTEPTLIDTAVLPAIREGAYYLLSPEGDKWAAYTIGNSILGEQATLHVHKIGDPNPPQPIFQKQSPTCTRSMHWQDNETIEFVYAICSNSKDRPIYFYVIDWEGKELTTRYEMPAIQEPPSASSISTNYYAPVIGDWFGDNNLFAFSISRFGGPTPAFNGLYILNLTTGEVQQILSNYAVFAVRSWLPLSTREE